MFWCAAYTQSGRELYARENLIDRGFEVFCPHERVVRRRRVGRRGYRVETVDKPVFPRYVFVRGANFMALKATPGVVDFVSSGVAPLRIPNKTMLAMMIVADDKGCMRASDITKPSFNFKGAIEDRFTFSHVHPLNGLIGKISSLAELDTTGEIEAWIEMLGTEHLISVPVSAVGHIVPRDGPRIAVAVG